MHARVFIIVMRDHVHVWFIVCPLFVHPLFPLCSPRRGGGWILWGYGCELDPSQSLDKKMALTPFMGLRPL